MSSIKKDLSNSIYFLIIVKKTPAGNGQGLFYSRRTPHFRIPGIPRIPSFPIWKIYPANEYLQAGINYSLY